MAITEEAARDAAVKFYADVDTNIVVDKLLEDDTHYAVSLRLLPGAEWLLGTPILFIRKEDGELEPGSSSEGPRVARMTEIS